ncbi:hypothetical protein AYO38_00650 [bacterium SCGC AG-212-C10]|nr:hypothetical protein AYO38_00650 [bacterium SCGC AG-212-C10]
MFAALLALSSVATSFAHAQPATIKPGDGSVLTEPPTTVEIVMTQDMFRQEGANDIDVFAPDGKEVTTIAAVVDNANRRRLSVPLPATLAVGDYRVEWKTLSADDGDTANGTFSFTYDPSKQPSAGKEQVGVVLGGSTTATSPPASSDGGPSGVTGEVPLSGLEGTGSNATGRSWVLVVAVAVAAFALGSGSTYLFVQKKT